MDGTTHHEDGQKGGDGEAEIGKDGKVLIMNSRILSLSSWNRRYTLCHYALTLDVEDERERRDGWGGWWRKERNIEEATGGGGRIGIPEKAVPITLLPFDSACNNAPAYNHHSLQRQKKTPVGLCTTHHLRSYLDPEIYSRLALLLRRFPITCVSVVPDIENPPLLSRPQRVRRAHQSHVERIFSLLLFLRLVHRPSLGLILPRFTTISLTKSGVRVAWHKSHRQSYTEYLLGGNREYSAKNVVPQL